MDYSILNDSELLNLMVKKDKDALGELYERYVRAVYSLSFKIVADRVVAEEIAQEVFISAWQKADTFNPGLAKAATWLLSIAHHKSIDYKRRLSERTVKVSLDDGYVGHLPQLQEEYDPLAHLWEEEKRMLIGNALQQIPENQREVILLAYFEGMTHSEISNKLSIPIGTTKTRIRLGMFKLKDILLHHSESSTLT